jgi:trans-2,3-dihydro-3-hydroxyanthranilate isomerase
MQTIANEFNLSETTFPVRATTDGASYRLRIFTPTSELPFAGHPSIGSAWVMRALGRVDDGHFVQECGAGLLPLTLEGDGATLTGGEASLGEPVDPAAALAAVGLGLRDMVGDPGRWAGVGIDFAYLHVRPESVARARPDLTALTAIGTAGISVFSYVDAVAHARVFAGGVGVIEDPATGSAALGLGVWLAATDKVAADGTTSYRVEQGAEIGRPSVMECVVGASAGSPSSCRSPVRWCRSRRAGSGFPEIASRSGRSLGLPGDRRQPQDLALPRPALRRQFTIGGVQPARQQRGDDGLPLLAGRLDDVHARRPHHEPGALVLAADNHLGTCPVGVGTVEAVRGGLLEAAGQHVRRSVLPHMPDGAWRPAGGQAWVGTAYPDQSGAPRRLLDQGGRGRGVHGLSVARGLDSLAGHERQ